MVYRCQRPRDPVKGSEVPGAKIVKLVLQVKGTSGPRRARAGEERGPGAQGGLPSRPAASAHFHQLL